MKDMKRYNIRQFVGLQIQERRKELGLSQQELAEKCGMIQATISKIERGRFSVSVDMLQRICDALHCWMWIELKTKD